MPRKNMMQNALAAVRLGRDAAQHDVQARDVEGQLAREVRGESVLTVLTEARLKELKNALRTTDEPIGEITARLGWSSPNYPKNLFKRKFGCMMQTWRRQSRAD